jgi:hypothetical protein
VPSDLSAGVLRTTPDSDDLPEINIPINPLLVKLFLNLLPKKQKPLQVSLKG